MQVPAPQLALDPPTVSLRPSHCGLKAGETQGAAVGAAGVGHCAPLTARSGGRGGGRGSRLWQEGPRKPGTHTQLPFSGMQVPPFLQVQVLLQLAPQKP